LAGLLFACTPVEVIPPSLRPDHEQPNPPTDPPTPSTPTDPDPPKPDALHDKEIPADFQIPIVRITTEGGKSIDSKKDWVQADFRFEDPCGFYTDTLLIEEHGRIRGRGNTTWGMPKKPYRIKLDKKHGVFGPNNNKDWILLANYSDKTLLRNDPDHLSSSIDVSIESHLMGFAAERSRQSGRKEKIGKI
jgi:hypothetical protein